MKWLLAREVVVALAVLGALFSLLASMLQSKVTGETARLMNLIGYAFMAASMILFIAAGFFTTPS
jgi:hypothetical protein